MRVLFCFNLLTEQHLSIDSVTQTNTHHLVSSPLPEIDKKVHVASQNADYVASDITHGLTANSFAENIDEKDFLAFIERHKVTESYLCGSIVNLQEKFSSIKALGCTCILIENASNFDVIPEGIERREARNPSAHQQIFFSNTL